MPETSENSKSQHQKGTHKARLGLRGPYDLVRKLNHDYKRLVSAQTKDGVETIYATYDCAVTSWSLVDWCYEVLPEHKRKAIAPPNGTRDNFVELAKREIRNLEFCRLLATGAKHFFVRSADDPGFDSGVTVMGVKPRRINDNNPGVKEIQYLPYVFTPGQHEFLDELFSIMVTEWNTFLRKYELDQINKEKPIQIIPSLD